VVAEVTKEFLGTVLIAVAISMAWASVVSEGFGVQISEVTGNFEASYNLAGHTLYVSFPPSLRDYYTTQSHNVNDQIGYAKFVTPSVFQSVAENMRKSIKNAPHEEEEFVNVVLKLVRKITYFKSNAKFPIETLFDNQADCDGLSILAASIIKAAGLDVVLLLYNNINPSHMNIGVYLEQKPLSPIWWIEPSGVEYDNRTYWMAECTPLGEWRIGDRPSLLESAKPQIIPLTNCEKDSPAQVSSSLDSPMQPSTISINLAGVHSNASISAPIVNVSGSISPALPNQPVVLYVNYPGHAPTIFKTLTDEFGSYTAFWNVTSPGTYVVRTSWRGFFNHSGSDSATVTVFIGAQKPIIEELSDEISSSQIVYESWCFDSPTVLSLFNKGSKEFLRETLTGTDILLSGDFMVLSDGREITPEETTITIPAHTIIFQQGRRIVRAIPVSEKEATIPGTELLNRHFGFILQQIEDNNYTATVKDLNEDDLSQINKNVDESQAVFINASTFAGKETWCKVVLKVTVDKVAVGVYDENGTQLDKMSQSWGTQDPTEVGVLMTYQTGQVITFKNLNVEFLNQNELPTTQTNGFEFSHSVLASLFSVGTVLAVAALWKSGKRRKNSKPNDSALS
jgi:hypothetical protein